nr:MFS transporter [Actinomycetota bacterium]
MRRLFLLAGAIVLVDTMFFAALTPLLPSYREELGLSKAGAGVLAAAYPAGVLVAGLPSGFAVTRLGVKPTVVAGLALMVTATLAFGFGSSIVVLDVARFVQGLASALAWTASLSWLTSSAPAARRGELIGSALAAAIVGALLGPVIGAVAALAGTRWTFGGIALLMLGLAFWAGATPA